MLVLADNNPLQHIRRPYANWALIGLCCAVFLLDPPYRAHGLTPELLQGAIHGGGIVTKSGLVAPPTDRGAVTRTAISHIFLHGSLPHLSGNMPVPARPYHPCEGLRAAWAVVDRPRAEA